MGRSAYGLRREGTVPAADWLDDWGRFSRQPSRVSPARCFSVACVLGGALLAIPLLVALITNQTTDTLFIQVSTYIGLPVAIIGLTLAVFVQMAIDLGEFIKRFRERSET